MIKRNQYFDLIRGFAIWLVTLGHSLQTFYPDWENSLVSKGISMFFMSFFIAISGYFFYPSVTKYSFREYTKKKFIHLYLPSLSWGLLSLTLIGGNKLLQNKELDLIYFSNLLFTGMWFLTVLFVLSIMGALIEHYVRSFKYTVWMIVYAIIYFTPPYWIINELKYLIPFFILSIYFKKYDWQKCPLWLFVVSLTLFVLLLNIFTFDFSLYRMTDEIFTIKYTYMAIIRFLSGISGIICSLYICKWINKIPYISNYYVYIGTLTLPIYVLHQKFLTVEKILHYKTENILMIIASSLIIIELSIITYRLLKKNKYIQLFLFGEKI